MSPRGSTPGVALEQPGAGALVALSLALLNAIVPPVLAALRLPFMVAIGFIAASCSSTRPADAGRRRLPGLAARGRFADALLMSLLIAAVGMRAAGHRRHQRRRRVHAARHAPDRRAGSGTAERTDVPGIIFLEIDGLALPVLRRAMRDGNAPTMARWIAEHGYHLAEWETDLSSQTGRQPGRHPARLQRGHPGVPLGREGDRDDDGLLLGRGLRRDRAPPLDRASACSPTAAPAAATCSPARPRTRS